MDATEDDEMGEGAEDMGEMMDKDISDWDWEDEEEESEKENER